MFIGMLLCSLIVIPDTEPPAKPPVAQTQGVFEAPSKEQLDRITHPAVRSALLKMAELDQKVRRRGGG
jgi:hypothetical protein